MIEPGIHRSLRYPCIYMVAMTKGNHKYRGLFKKQQMKTIMVECFFQIHQERSISKITSKEKTLRKQT